MRVIPGQTLYDAQLEGRGHIPGAISYRTTDWDICRQYLWKSMSWPGPWSTQQILSAGKSHGMHGSRITSYLKERAHRETEHLMKHMLHGVVAVLAVVYVGADAVSQDGGSCGADGVCSAEKQPSSQESCSLFICPAHWRLHQAPRGHT